MRGRNAAQSLASNPTMVGAITTLIVIVAVFLAYNANNGLPFVPTYRVSVEIPNASRLVRNNEVRIGGHRVGVVETIEAVNPEKTSGGTETTSEEGTTSGTVSANSNVARLSLKLDQAVKPLPQDSEFRVRYRSSFGLKYLEITRGNGAGAPDGYTFPASQTIPQTEFDDINDTFNTETRENARRNLEGFGNAFAGRGASLNQAIESLNPLLTNLKPVAKVLVERDTQLRRFFPALADTARIVAPVAEEQADFFTQAAIAFAAISEDPQALKDTISEGVPTLETGIRTLPRQRPFLADFTELSRRLRPGVHQLRFALPPLNEAVQVGTPVLRRSPSMNRKLKKVFVRLKDLVEQPSTKVTLERLGETFDEAEPLAKFVVPAQTVCNYWNYWFTVLPEHLSERDQVGFTQRIRSVNFPMGSGTLFVPPNTTVPIPGEVETGLGGYSGLQANGKAGQLSSAPGEFQPYELPILHGNPYGPSGQQGTNADCQAGQTGYALGQFRVPGQGADNPTFGIPDLPGSRGPTTVFWDQNGNRQLRDTRVSGRFPNQ
jgi:ABC-type transporter Mla subunit MlaD